MNTFVSCFLHFLVSSPMWIFLAVPVPAYVCSLLWRTFCFKDGDF